MCLFYDISRKTLNIWLNRYNKSNKEESSLLPQSRRPKTNDNMPTKESEVIEKKLAA